MVNPDPELKGVEGGNCNRTACQQPGAVWYNSSTRKYYCRNCAITIQQQENDFKFLRRQMPITLFDGLRDPTDPRHAR